MNEWAELKEINSRDEVDHNDRFLDELIAGRKDVKIIQNHIDDADAGWAGLERMDPQDQLHKIKEIIGDDRYDDYVLSFKVLPETHILAEWARKEFEEEITEYFLMQ